MYHTPPFMLLVPYIEKWLRLGGPFRIFLKWCLACAAYAAVRRAGRLLTYP